MPEPTKRDGLPLTIAYLRIYYFFVESTFDFTLSFDSTTVLDESVTVVVTLSVVFTESVFVSVLPEPPQAAKEVIANKTKSFFIVMYLFVNDLVLIQGLGKSNLLPGQKFAMIC